MTSKLEPQPARQLGQTSLVSETYVPQVMPPLLGTGDLTALFLLNVFWVTNITPIVAGGTASFTYWILTGLLFFIPCSLVMAQLAAVFPYTGSIYNWTYHALGPGWSFFVGVCAWLPGVLSIVNAAAAVVSCLQALNSDWIIPPWQQGLTILGVLAFTGFLSCQRTRTVQHILNVAVGGMGLATLLIILAAVGWVVKGHPSATNFADPSGWRIITTGPQANLALLGSATLALLGSDMPLSMAGEIKKRKAITRHLTWGTTLTLAGYLIFTFALLLVQGANTAANTANPILLLISTVDGGLGKTLGNVMAICLLFYFLLIPAALNLCFARLLVVAAIDRRVSVRFAKLNRERVPVNALVAQILIAIFFTVLIYFLAPSISFLGKPADLNSEVYNVLGASLLLVWAVSFMFPFIDVAALYLRDQAAFRRKQIMPLPLLAFSVITGTVLCVVTIVITLFNSFIPTLIPNTTWWYVVGALAFVCLVFCAMGSMVTNSEALWEETGGTALPTGVHEESIWKKSS